MRVSVTDAKAQLTHLMRRAEAGDDVTHYGFAHRVRVTTEMPLAPGGIER
ncbi:MAG: type II toxin-antitoxin system prevent-host-death family antitoxin [Hyphomicrobiales bacterium]|nr:type II toxin-antitoxin system prevent-host-death family antitoxin [Hyphomicrobiales bacterium]